MMARPNPKAHGFTLMEVLVVLVLVSLLTGLLMEGFAYVLRLRFSVTTQLKRQRVQQLQEHWYRNLLTGLMVNSRDEPTLFKGSPTVLQGQSINTLDAHIGVLQTFTLTLDIKGDHTTLRYQSSNAENWILGEWTAGTAAFSYLDYQGHWLSDWPPKFGVVSQQLPNAIQVHIASETQPITWLVSLPGRTNPKPRLDDLL
ncbi:MAG: prepilin-type N-terminal cleavage/methylation domain-containing protein [Methylococcaceae bacterium]|nr:prepilin-type N-terminal cleavage/methylation domain-containing protein [Methylococcaceae bacterium]